MDKVIYFGIILFMLVGVTGVIVTELWTPPVEPAQVPVCLIDKPVEDCHIYESGNAAWTPVIIAGGP